MTCSMWASWMLFFNLQRIKNKSGDEETTCDRPDNPYTSPIALKKTPKGVQLDYIMFRSNSGKEKVSTLLLGVENSLSSNYEL